MPAEERRPAPEAHLNRRALFGAALAMSASPAAVAAQPGSAADLYRRYLHARDAYSALPIDVPEEVDDVYYEAFGKLQNETLDAPIRTAADAAVKIRLACVGFDGGFLANGKDCAALEQVARWLEAL
jgi:hypothetical protein